MPKRTGKNRTTSGVGKGSRRRKKPQGLGCKITVGTTKTAKGVIANSLFALTLKVKPAVEVNERIDQPLKGWKPYSLRDYRDDNFETMYADLLASYRNGLKLMKKRGTFIDPEGEDVTIHDQLSRLIQAFKKDIFPHAYSYNVEMDDMGNYYFVIFEECEFREEWTIIPVKRTARMLLRQNNQRLHDLYLIFLKTLISSTGILTWWDGALGYSDYMVDEELANFDDHYDYLSDRMREKRFCEVVAEVKEYRSGQASEYEDLICKSPIRTPDWLINKLKVYKRSKVARWMISVCDFLKKGFAMDEYKYRERDDHMEGLEFDLQVGVLWDTNDYMSDMQLQSLDSEAQGVGVIPPIYSIALSPATQKLDFKDFAIKTELPNELQTLFNNYPKIK